VERFAEAFRANHDRLDLLINNAGVMIPPLGHTNEGFELQRRLEAKGSKVLATAAHPGWTGTDLQRHSGLIRFLNFFFAQTPPMGALPTLRAATAPDATGGNYFGPKGFYEMRGYPVTVGTTPAAKNELDARRLWEVSEKLTGVSFESLRTNAA